MLYDLAYMVLLLVASPWLLWQRWRYGKYRDGLGAKLLGRTEQRLGAAPCAWFHAVSVGEVMLLGRLIQEFRREHPGWVVVVTATTSTGYELARKRYPDCVVSYAPLDFSWAVAEAMRRLRPDLLVLAELELWPNLIEAADRRQIPIAIVNGRLSEKSFRGYRRVRPLVAHWLRRIDWIGVQTSEYADRFLRLGAPLQSVAITGSLKFDRAEFDRRNPRTETLRHLMGLDPTTPVWIVGSTQDPEETLAWQVYQQARASCPKLRLIIVPRHQERFDEVAAALEVQGARVVRRSRLMTVEDVQASSWATQSETVLLVDTIGELGAWWGLADLAFVGGSLGSRGGQNMIEPAAYGAAVSFGPETRNFRDVVQLLLDAQAAVVVHDAKQLFEFVSRSLRDRAWANQLGRRAQEVVRQQQGATWETLRGLELLIGTAPVANASRAA